MTKIWSRAPSWLTLTLAIGAAWASGCASRPRERVTSESAYTRPVVPPHLDGGADIVTATSTPPLPLPPPPARRGIIVPSDVGLGKGPAGPTTNSGASPGAASLPGAPSEP